MKKHLNSVRHPFHRGGSQIIAFLSGGYLPLVEFALVVNCVSKFDQSLFALRSLLKIEKIEIIVNNKKRMCERY